MMAWWRGMLKPEAALNDAGWRRWRALPPLAQLMGAQQCVC